MKLPYSAPLALLTRQFSAVLMSMLLSSWGCISLPQPAKAFGIDAGTFGATGGMIDCADSGVLVALAGPGRKLGNCPLYHTDVQANVSGYVARVTVRQQFHNPYKEKIEAVYTFPLPENAAVDEMTMKVGSRVIKGSIKKKQEARDIYETAKSRGHVASLLDQERPNIFNQSVANIEPGQNIDIEIKYVNLLKYENGSFTFAFPTVVGPRFIPGNVVDGKRGVGRAYDTDIVPDASKITPHMAAVGERAGHDISIALNINAGVPIQTVSSKLHEVDVSRPSPNLAQIKLKDKDKIPNKDFVATWNVAADSIQSGYLTHKEGKDGFFTLMLIPPKRVAAATVQPKEMVFLIDCSGSQSGLPIEKAKETMEYIVEHMNPNDTFQVLTFNNNVTQLSPQPMAASAAMKSKAIEFIRPIQAGGGTWMAPAVEEALNLPNDEHRLRVVTFMTDGFVGNDMQVIGMIKKYRGSSRWFSFGTGNSVNRFLIDNIAKEGGGEAEYVLLNSSAQEVGKKFYDRISSPVLTDIKLEFEGLEAKEIFPRDPADLWAQKPVFITGRYNKAGSGKVIMTGYSGGKKYRQELKLDFPETQNANDVLPSIWARAKVDRLMSEDWMAAQVGQMNKEIKEEIEKTALDYHILSQFTSFVAVEEDKTTKGGDAKVVPVKVETPDGVQMESNYPKAVRHANRQTLRHGGGGMVPPSASYGGYVGSGSGSGSGGGGGLSAGTTTGVHGAMRGSFEHYGHFEPGAWAKKAPSSAGPVPVMASGGGSSSYYKVQTPPPIMRSSGYGLPPTNMGKFVHQPGDNQYQPSASPSPMRQHQRAANYYRAPREIQIIDERPVIRDFREAPSSGASAMMLPSIPPSIPSSKPEAKEEGWNAAAPVRTKDKESEKSEKRISEKAQDTASNKTEKLDAKLRQLLESSTKSGKLQSKVKVRIQLTISPGSALLDKLNKAGLNINKRDGVYVIGLVELSKIRDLALLAEVLRILLD